MTSNDQMNIITWAFLQLSMTEGYWFMIFTPKHLIVPIPIREGYGDFHNGLTIADHFWT